jgi:hypothetical protein
MAGACEAARGAWARRLLLDLSCPVLLQLQFTLSYAKTAQKREYNGNW